MLKVMSLVGAALSEHPALYCESATMAKMLEDYVEKALDNNPGDRDLVQHGCKWDVLDHRAGTLTLKLNGSDDVLCTSFLTGDMEDIDKR
jgi:hypothetical protein